jgi:hypothetical protein
MRHFSTACIRIVHLGQHLIPGLCMARLPLLGDDLAHIVANGAEQGDIPGRSDAVVAVSGRLGGN